MNTCKRHGKKWSCFPCHSVNVHSFSIQKKQVSSRVCFFAACVAKILAADFEKGNPLPRTSQNREVELAVSPMSIWLSRLESLILASSFATRNSS